MMVDREKISLFSPAFSDVNDEIDQRMLKLKPFMLIRTRGGVPQQYKIPGITNADIEVKRMFEDSYKRLVGIDERVLGISPEGATKTATEIAFLREAALRRLREFAFIYKKALLEEIKFKMLLSKQYYSSPFSRDEKTSGDGIKKLKIKAKRFKIKTGDNVYTKKDISPSFFEGDIDVDIDMKILIPMTQAQQISKWSQILADAFPLVQQGVIDVSIEKIFKRYLDGFEVSIDTLRQDKDAEAIKQAEGEHKLFANENTSSKMLKVLPNGTELAFLTPAHLKRHQELLETDDKIGEKELTNLIEHITKDTENLKNIITNAQQPQQLGGGAPQGTPQIATPQSAPQAEPFIAQGQGQGLQ